MASPALPQIRVCKMLLMWNKSEITHVGTARFILRNAQNKKKYSVEFIDATRRVPESIEGRHPPRMAHEDKKSLPSQVLSYISV